MMFPHLSIVQWIGWSLFLIFSVGIILFSRRSLIDPRHYGFYRFFAFEALLGIVFLNIRIWFEDPFSPHHILSWVLLILALAIAIHSFRLLKREGLPAGQIEQTTRLVSQGAYRYIRHPLYTSLILFGWGIYLKHPLPLTTTLIFTTCGLLAATAIVEEQQNLKKFGEEYRQYMEKTKRFIPFLF